MKQVFKAFLSITIFSVLIYSCGNEGGEPKVKTSDTSRVIGVYVDYDGRDIKHDIIFRVIKDSFGFVSEGGDIMKKKWHKDTLYFIPLPGDTLKDNVTKMPLKDSTGRFKIEPKWGQVRNNTVWDENIIVDSAVNRFKKYLVTPDTTKRPN